MAGRSRGREASLRNRPVFLPGLLAVAACLFAAPVAAQQAQPVADSTPGSAPAPSPGMRYLSWAGKAAAPARPQALPTAAASDGLRRPASIIARRPVGSSAVPAPATAMASPAAARPSRYGATASRGLTPASEWMPAAANQPTPSVGETTATPYVSAPPRPLAETRTPAPAPAPAPADEASVAPAPLAAPASEAQPATAEFDPMAPRRDALIYRMQGARPADQTATAPAAPTGQAAPQPTPYALADQGRDGARYYSVHRAAGHQPDRTAMPEAVYLDTAPIDLAEPPPTPVVPRTVNGRAQVIVPNEDPSLP